MPPVVGSAGIHATQGPVLAFGPVPSRTGTGLPTRPSARDRRDRGRFARAHPLLFR